ncbi:MAG: hypothetical protein KC931_10265 [Candidatus Omnitrophica bacterium]|nr:hypothetical protein [Candidatus Omnitrophota bacterium]
MGCQIRATTKGTAIAIAILVAAFVITGLPVMALFTVIHPRMTMVTSCHVQVQIGLVGTAISEAGTDRSCPPKEEREA